MAAPVPGSSVLDSLRVMSYNLLADQLVRLCPGARACITSNREPAAPGCHTFLSLPLEASPTATGCCAGPRARGCAVRTGAAPAAGLGVPPAAAPPPRDSLLQGARVLPPRGRPPGGAAACAGPPRVGEGPGMSLMGCRSLAVRCASVRCARCMQLTNLPVRPLCRNAHKCQRGAESWSAGV